MILYDHQKEGVRFARQMGANVALFWDMGTGKTVTTLKIFEALKAKLPTYKMVVACPLTLIKNAWQDDVEKFTDFDFCSMRGKINPQADVFAFNYEMLTTRKIEDIQRFFEARNVFFVLDESSRIKNYHLTVKKKGSKRQNKRTAIAMMKLKYETKYRMILSGTPFPNGEHELWSQMDFIRPGILGPSFNEFRGKYFHMERGRDIISCPYNVGEFLKRGWKLTISPAKREAMMRIIEPYTSWLKLDDCVDLPDAIDEYIKVDMLPKQAKIYKGMEKDLVAEIGDEVIIAQIILTKLIKLRQATSGFMYSEDKELIRFTTLTNDPKICALKDYLERIGDKQAIIWVNFIPEVELLVSLLGDRCATLYSETKNKDESIRRFKAREVQYLVANPQSAAHGLTFVNCHYEIFYSLTYSQEHYAQARGRTRRVTQKERCVYVHLLCRGTIDEVILQVVQGKGKNIQIVEDYIKELKKK